MPVVLDTNTVISALLWNGAPRQLLNAAYLGSLSLATSPQLLVELEDVLSRLKFRDRLAQARTDARMLTLGYAALATCVRPAAIPPVVAADPDDDAVIACAVAAGADAIVSGDGHLLGIKAYLNIPIITANEMLQRLPVRHESPEGLPP